MKETIKLINDCLIDQTSNPKNYQKVSEEKGYNFGVTVTYKIDEINKLKLKNQLKIGIIKEISNYLFKDSEVVKEVYEDWFQEKYSYYFENSRGAKKYITNIYVFFQNNEYLEMDYLIDQIFGYQVEVDQNGCETIYNDILTELLEVLKRIEYKKNIQTDVNITKLIDEFKTLIYPNNEQNYNESQKRFDDICKILKAKDYIIKVNDIEYFDFEPINLYTFAYCKIRSSIPEDKRRSGAVPWEERRQFINNKMKFTKKNKILTEEINKELSEITFTYIDETNLDNTLKDIANYIEHKLKTTKKYYDLTENEKYNSFNFIPTILNNESIMDYKKKIQCFRHFHQKSIAERKSYSKKEKEVLMAYGHAICLMISDIETGEKTL